MRKRSLAVKLLAIVCLAVFAMGYKTFQHIRAKNAYYDRVASFPDLPLLSPDSLVFIPAVTKKPTVVILFNPDCDHCRSQAKEIQSNGSALEGAHLLMITTSPLPEIRKFSEEFGMSDYSNIQFGKISSEALFNIFGPTTVPHIFVYSQERKLIKEFKGTTTLKAILQSIN